MLHPPTMVGAHDFPHHQAWIAAPCAWAESGAGCTILRPMSPIRGALLFCLLTVACKSGGGLPEVKGGVELGLRRGSAWSTLTVRMPYVIGPRVQLELKRGVFTGSINGYPVHLNVEADGVAGSGPMGQVAIDLSEGPDKLVIEGTWNGSRVHFEITSASLRGSVAVYVRGSSGDIPRAPTAGDVHTCQYVLDKVERDGSRSGTSICDGLPEDTLVEVPRAVLGWLTRQELAVVLLALLSAPPYTTMETL